MKAELTQKLFNKYPKIFSKTERDTKDNLLYFGIDHDDGWYGLIDNLCNAIQTYIDSDHNIPQVDRNKPQVVAVQVKEKFGMLRFYVEASDEFIEGMIRLAENLSGTICEKCGTTKKVGKTCGWIKTLCKSCYLCNDILSKREWIANTVA